MSDGGSDVDQEDGEDFAGLGLLTSSDEEGDDDLEEEEDVNEEEVEGGEEARVYLPHMKEEDADSEDAALEFDESTYIIYHAARTKSPCLSFDILPSHSVSSSYPLAYTLFTGTQDTNQLMLLRLSNLHRNMQKSSNDDDDEEEQVIDKKQKPKISTVSWKHKGSVNRVRCSGDGRFGAVWSSTGAVSIWDVAEIDRENVVSNDAKPLLRYVGHTSEGFALDWSAASGGSYRLLSGDGDGKIRIWLPNESSWSVDSAPFSDHSASVEDIHWSPNEATVFASCSSDKSIKIWDTRVKTAQLSNDEAHSDDVNVIAWNRNEPFIASGGDDCLLRVWDLRSFAKKKPIASFKHHTQPISSIEWYRMDSTVFAAASADDQVTLWDLSVEKIDDAESVDVPPQLLFIHQGLRDPKEIHWSPNDAGMLIATGENAFDLFRTISV